MPMLTLTTEDRLGDLLLRWDELRRKGRDLSAGELCVDCPELAGELRRRIEVVRGLEPVLDVEPTRFIATPGEGDPEGLGPARRLPDDLHATAVYRPQRYHAQGGLGEVLAARQEELDRTVALKRIRPERLHEAARRRFLREAAITARLQHPGIVPIYGLGQDEDGPFYTMPFIDGQTLQQAIDSFHGDESLRRDTGRRALKFRGLLQQFIAVCNTMAYAHDQGVIHRDLKPSNIMLGPYGETLVMDWGLAKRLGTDDDGGEVEGNAPSPSPSPDALTATGAVLGTPHYMSPEQARGEPTSPASDVFSLGLVLYAILIGKSPYTDAVIPVGGIQEAVREAAVVPPRRRDPGLPGALEAICLKALALEPEARYRSVGNLAHDVESWMADEPVSARRDPLAERARRWMRRNRTAVATAVVAGIVGLGAVAAVQVRYNVMLIHANSKLTDANEATNRALAETQKEKTKAEQALAESEAVSSFLVEVFRSPDPSQDGLQINVADLLDRASERLNQGFAGPKVIKGALLNALGNTYSGLGLHDRAVSLHIKAAAVRESVLGSDHHDTLKSRSSLAAAYREAGRLFDAIELQRATLKRLESTLAPDHPDTLTSRHNLAVAYHSAGRLSEAIALFEATLKFRETALGPDHPDTLTSRNAVAVAYSSVGRLPEAIALDVETLRRRVSVLGSDHPDTLKTRNNLAVKYYRAGRYSEAIAHCEMTLKHREMKLGPDHPNTLDSRDSLALNYQAVGRFSEAIALYETLLKLRKVKLGPDHPDTLGAQNNLALTYWSANRLPEAIALHESTLKLYETRLGPDHPNTLTSRNNLARAYKAAGWYAEAIALHESTLKLRETKLGPDHPDTLTTRRDLASTYHAAGRLPEAIALYESTCRLQAATPGNEGEMLWTRSSLAEAYESLGRWAEAEALYRDVLADRRKIVQPNISLLADDLTALGRNLLLQSRPNEAEPLLREAMVIREKATTDDWSRFNTMSLLGGALLGQGQYADAEPRVVLGYEGMSARAARITVPEKFRLREALERAVRLYEA
jgi:eukaryotic-like serine/threonine-protein kinase